MKKKVGMRRKLVGGLMGAVLLTGSIAMIPGTVGAAPFNLNRMISVGETSEEVRYIQQCLNNAGIPVVADGYYGEKTADAVRYFQGIFGLVQDGEVGPKTLAMLDYFALGATYNGSGEAQPAPATQPSTPTYQGLYIGQRSSDVTKMQQALKDLGYNVYVDGYYGNKTAEVVKAYQKANGLYVDGVAGPKTLAKLYSGSSVPASTPAQEPASQQPATPSYRGLSIGERSSDVTKMQQALKDLGYDVYVDGYYGNKTAEVVKTYQKANGLYVDGVAGPKTLAKLYSGQSQAAPEPAAQPTDETASYNLKKGSQGDQVKKVQEALTKLNFYSGLIDGDYGDRTVTAVQDFQRFNGLYVDGEVGPKTAKVLFSGSATSRENPVNTDKTDVQKAADAILNQVGWDLWAAYRWSSDIRYVDRANNPSVNDGAMYAFRNKEGDCMAKASAFCVLARELGFECNVIWGAVLLGNGRWADHAWTEIGYNGSVYVCDPEFEYEAGRNGWMISYGQSGTWKYRKDANLGH